MAARPIDPKKAEAIVIDWRCGQLSQEDIADKHKVSKGTVNKLCKGIAQDGKAIVTAGIQYNQALKGHDDRMATAIEGEVKSAVERQEWLSNAALVNVREAMALPCGTQREFKDRAETILKGKETIFGKQPDTAIQINNGANERPRTRADFYADIKPGTA